MAVHVRLWPFWPVYLGLMALAMGFDALWAPRRKDVACSVEMPGTLYIGEEEEARADRQGAVRCGGCRWRWRSTSRTGWCRSRRCADGSPPGAAELRLRLVPTRRGRIVVERAWVRSAGPLGLIATVARVELKRQAPVIPNIRPVKAVALRFLTDREFRTGLKIERYKGDGTEFDSLKEHAPGTTAARSTGRRRAGTRSWCRGSTGPSATIRC